MKNSVNSVYFFAPISTKIEWGVLLLGILSSYTEYNNYEHADVVLKQVYIYTVYNRTFTLYYSILGIELPHVARTYGIIRYIE